MTKFIRTTDVDGSVAEWDVPDEYELVAGQEFISEPAAVGHVADAIVAQPAPEIVPEPVVASAPEPAETSAE